MKIIKIFFLVLLLGFGVFLFVYGGYDDSPGGQLLGLVAIVMSIASLVRIGNQT